MTEAIEAFLAEARRAREEGRASDSRDGYARAAALSREAGASWTMVLLSRFTSSCSIASGSSDALTAAVSAV